MWTHVGFSWVMFPTNQQVSDHMLGRFVSGSRFG